MCLAIPLQLTKVSGTSGQVKVGKASLEVSLVLLDEVCVGDYVLVHAGFAINKLDENEAQESLRLLREVGL